MSISNSLRFKIFTRDGFTCMYCGAQPPSVALEVDHVVAISRGGSDDPNNLLTACVDCNRAKSALNISEGLILYRILRENSHNFNQRAADLVLDAESTEAWIEEITPIWGDL